MAQTVAYFCFYFTKVKLETPVTKKTVAELLCFNMESLWAWDYYGSNSNTDVLVLYNLRANKKYINKYICLILKAYEGQFKMQYLD